MANRTPPSQWGNLFNFAGGGLVHFDLFATLAVSENNPTLFEAITRFTLLYGTHANRPSAADVPLNALYCCSTHSLIYQNQAGTWVTVADIGGGSGTGTLGGARVYHNTTQSLANATQTALTFNSERYDTDSYHSTTTNPTRLTVPATGVYLVGGSYQLDNSSSQITQLTTIFTNGSTAIAQLGSGDVGPYNAHTLNTIVSLTAADYVELSVLQGSAGSMNVFSTSDVSPEFWIERLR